MSKQSQVRLNVHSTRKDLRRNPATLEESIGWSYNAVLTGFAVKPARDGWLVVIKADFGDRPRVSYLEVRTFGRACEVASEFADRGLLHFVHDKYPPKLRWRRRNEFPISNSL